VDVPAVGPLELATAPAGESSAAVAARVAKAREIQSQRYRIYLDSPRPVRTNADAEGEVLEQAALLESTAQVILSDAADKLKLTARSYHRVLKVARTIADLAGADMVGRVHVAEALSYRRLNPALMNAA
jgi:magnesium chelatase family protein